VERIRKSRHYSLLNLSAVLLVGCAWTYSRAQNSSGPPPAAQTFKSTCAVCHGVDGSANAKLGQQLHAPALYSQDVQKLSDDELKQVITKGKANMPAFGEQLSPVEIEQLVKYVRVLSKATKP
jgi:mono/diheme cytochrome c family protein